MKIEKKQVIYIIQVIMLSLVEWSKNSQIINLEEFTQNIILFAVYAMLLVYIFNNKTTAKEFFKKIFLIFCGTLVYYFTKNTIMLTIIIVLLASKYANVDTTIKTLYYINIFLLLVHICYYLVYLILAKSDLSIVTRLKGDKIIYRYAFFMIHPNVFANYVFWTVAMYYYLYFDKIKISTYIMTFLLAMFIYYFPNSRTSAILILMLIILTLISKKGIKIKYIKSIYFIISVILFILMMLQNNQITLVVDNLLSTRITMATVSVEKYGIKLFGNDIATGIKTAYANGKYVNNIANIDCLYYSLILNYGLVSYIIFSYLIMKVDKKRNSEEDMKYNEKSKIMIILLLLYGITESICLIPVVSFPLLLLSRVI